MNVNTDLTLIGTHDMLKELATRYDATMFIGIRRGHDGGQDILVIKHNTTNIPQLLRHIAHMAEKGSVE